MLLFYFIFFTVVQLLAIWPQPPHWWSKPLLTCLLTCPLLIFKKLDSFLVLEKQAANKALLHHIQGEIFLS